MDKINFTILGVGNILELDDAVAVYATEYLEKNYTFEPEVNIINGGVEGINLLNVFMENNHILILDAINIDDKAGSIYHIPSSELSGYGVNSGGAHEVGVMQCLDMLELMDKPIPESSVLGIVPELVEVRIGLSDTLMNSFDVYIDTVLKILEKENITALKNQQTTTLDAIIGKYKV